MSVRPVGRSLSDFLPLHQQSSSYSVLAVRGCSYDGDGNGAVILAINIDHSDKLDHHP
jgi:hypothetical protein